MLFDYLLVCASFLPIMRSCMMISVHFKFCRIMDHFETIFNCVASTISLNCLFGPMTIFLPVSLHCPWRTRVEYKTSNDNMAKPQNWSLCNFRSVVLLLQLLRDFFVISEITLKDLRDCVRQWLHNWPVKKKPPAAQMALTCCSLSAIEHTHNRHVCAHIETSRPNVHQRPRSKKHCHCVYIE